MLITSIIVGLNYMYNTTIELSTSLSQLGFNIAWKCPIRSIHIAIRNNVYPYHNISIKQVIKKYQFYDGNKEVCLLPVL